MGLQQLRLYHHSLSCRVLIFLEAEALGRAPPSFAPHFIPPLLEAAQRLGLRSLEVGGRRQGFGVAG